MEYISSFVESWGPARTGPRPLCKHCRITDRSVLSFGRLEPPTDLRHVDTNDDILGFFMATIKEAANVRILAEQLRNAE